MNSQGCCCKKTHPQCDQRTRCVAELLAQLNKSKTQCIKHLSANDFQTSRPCTLKVTVAAVVLAKTDGRTWFNTGAHACDPLVLAHSAGHGDGSVMHSSISGHTNSRQSLIPTQKYNSIHEISRLGAKSGKFEPTAASKDTTQKRTRHWPEQVTSLHSQHTGTQVVRGKHIHGYAKRHVTYKQDLV